MASHRRRNVSKLSNRYKARSSAREPTGSATWLRSAMAQSVSGEIVPSRCTCSSALGMATSASFNRPPLVVPGPLEAEQVAQGQEVVEPLARGLVTGVGALPHRRQRRLAHQVIPVL